MTKLSGREIAERAPGGWVYLLGVLRTRLRTGDFATGLALVDAIGAVAEEMDHHPDLDLRYGFVDVRTSSHDVGAVTGRDLRLAQAISELAGRAGVALDPAGLGGLEWALDTPAANGVAPFWAAVLGMRQQDHDGVNDEVRDPSGTLPAIWFQRSGSEEPRQRWHPDVWIDPSEVPTRIDAAVAAGGTLVSDANAPSFWVLADPEGNKVCLCTWQDRG
ncbi:4a-hydroxytetrahydrobiopterin dehydratase [Actinoplanes sp. SE50]|uniref:VOC family protein n=1 Tax=unclassified Actinoplanes TaxID=2626549 RepID=UPI00023ECEEB|nr:MULTISPECIES: VOC family protein [unclassified Actinoplanes]AEV86047.1 4a-hydroxytetrahydrobiopterin dehydratase [Actinoplanes sp. SE50/110]ATO84445.1 4a-hydroxytetrahydrobiopterin dehydratase [Actinoplanes sp. SE50]SLM01855.1 4a-hydroxytetrahydrobiopterin dehydratase [Actinoplanes sp. SE50/110]